MSQIHFQGLSFSDPLECSGGGGGRKALRRDNMRTVTFVIAEREFVTVPCKASKFKLSPELSIYLSRTVLFCLKELRDLHSGDNLVHLLTYTPSLGLEWSQT